MPTQLQRGPTKLSTRVYAQLRMSSNSSMVGYNLHSSKLLEKSHLKLNSLKYFISLPSSINQKCVDPCPGSCGLNTECAVINHTPSCRCALHYTGDPFQGCSPVQGKYHYLLLPACVQFSTNRYQTSELYSMFIESKVMLRNLSKSPKLYCLF